MQYSLERTVRRVPLAILFLLPLLGCSDGTRWTDSAELLNQLPVTIAGSVGDGPIVNADITVFDAHGTVVVRTSSDDQANYVVKVPPGTKFPVRVVATGGLDLVSGDPADFPLEALLFKTSDSHVNISPMTTIVTRGAACRPAGTNARNVSFMWDALLRQWSMGLDHRVMADPMHDVITSDNAAAVVFANEGVGEAIRRLHRALQTTDVAADMENWLAASPVTLPTARSTALAATCARRQRS
jgi:hypothetical protein